MKIDAYIALEKPNNDWPGITTFDAEYAQFLRCDHRVYKIGTVNCDKIIKTYKSTEIITNGKRYDNIYHYLADNNPIEYDPKLGETYTNQIKRQAHERKKLKI